MSCGFRDAADQAVALPVFGRLDQVVWLTNGTALAAFRIP